MLWQVKLSIRCGIRRGSTSGTTGAGLASSRAHSNPTARIIIIIIIAVVSETVRQVPIRQSTVECVGLSSRLLGHSKYRYTTNLPAYAFFRLRKLHVYILSFRRSFQIQRKLAHLRQSLWRSGNESSSSAKKIISTIIPPTDRDRLDEGFSPDSKNKQPHFN